MFEEEEEQQQDVAPLKAALEEAAAAAEAQGRSKQHGQAAASHGPTTLSHTLSDPLPLIPSLVHLLALAFILE